MTPRRAALAAVLSGAAALGGAAYAYHLPSTYNATSTIFVGRVIPGTAGGNVATVVATFQTALKLPQTLEKVAKGSGVTVASLDSDLKDAEIASSSAVTVSFSNTSPSVASNVVTSATRDALLSLGSQQVYGAQDQVSAAQKALSAAESDIAAFNARHGTEDFGTQFQEAEQNALNLEDALAAASPQQAPAINKAIQAEQAQLNRMSSADPQWQLLDVALTQAQGALQTANEGYTTAEGNLIAASSPTVLTPPQVIRDSRLSPTIRLGLMSAVVMLLLILGSFVGLGILERGVEKRRLEEEEEEARRKEKEWTGPWRRSSDREPVDASSGRLPTPSPDSDATIKSGLSRPQGQS
jgi:hypothetical protein